jgi:hypothetical protein
MRFVHHYRQMSHTYIQRQKLKLLLYLFRLVAQINRANKAYPFADRRISSSGFCGVNYQLIENVNNDVTLIYWKVESEQLNIQWEKVYVWWSIDMIVN